MFHDRAAHHADREIVIQHIQEPPAIGVRCEFVIVIQQPEGGKPNL